MQIFLLALATFFILSFRNGSLIEGKGKKKSKAGVHPGEANFCAKKYDECINQKLRGPYKSSKKGCEHKLSRKYYCTAKLMHKPLTEPEKKKGQKSRTIEDKDEAIRNEPSSDEMPTFNPAGFPESLADDEPITFSASSSSSSSSEERTTRARGINDTRTFESTLDSSILIAAQVPHV